MKALIKQAPPAITLDKEVLQPMPLDWFYLVATAMPPTPCSVSGDAVVTKLSVSGDAVVNIYIYIYI